MLSNSRSPQPEQSPIPPSSLLQVVQSNQRQVQQQDITQPPVRPPRNGATLSTDILYGESSQLDAEEKKALMREIVEKKLTIVEMKKKEQWWKTEVSLARHLFPSIQHSSQDDPPLIDFSNESHDGDRFEMYRKLVQIKTELRKTRDSITRQTEPIVEKMEQAEAIRVAALEEASFYKARYMALKSRDAEKLKELDDERSVKLEKRLVDAYAEHGARTRTLQQLQKQLQQDQSARLMAEQRAKNAQILAESAQEAHQHVLEELAHLHAHILRAEDQGRRDALEIANLSSQLAQQLSMQENDFSKTNIEIARIEASNMKYRNETASLQNQLEESKHQEMLLKQIMNEKEEAYLDAVCELEQTNIQLELMKQSSKKHLAKLVGEE